MKIAQTTEPGSEEILLTSETEAERLLLDKMRHLVGYGVFERPASADPGSPPVETALLSLRPYRDGGTTAQAVAIAELASAAILGSDLRFLGTDPRAVEIASAWRAEIADMVRTVILDHGAKG